MHFGKHTGNSSTECNFNQHQVEAIRVADIARDCRQSYAGYFIKTVRVYIHTNRL